MLFRSHRFIVVSFLFLAFVCCKVERADAGLVGTLGTIIPRLADEQFDVELWLQAEPSSIGLNLEFINIDIRKSRFNINGVASDLTDLGRVTLDLAPEFVSWDLGGVFGDPFVNQPSEVMLAPLDPINGAKLLDSQPFLLGTFCLRFLQPWIWAW